jgi:hypothetical protein
VSGIILAVYAQKAGNNAYVAMPTIPCMIPSRTSLRMRPVSEAVATVRTNRRGARDEDRRVCGLRATAK